MKNKLLFFVLVFFGLRSYAQIPTWNSGVAKVFYDHCTTCHHPGGIGPTSFMTYTAAYNQRYLALKYIDSLVMPPYPPDPTYSHLAFEKVLSQAEKDKIRQWVYYDGPLGAGPSPTVPVYTTGSQLSSTPDLSLVMPTYTVNAPNHDLYRCFVIPTNLSTFQMANEIEILAGNPSIVHHVLVFEDTTTKPVLEDAKDAEPGYTSFYGTKSDDSKLVSAWVPGGVPIKFPANMGVKLRKNTRLVMQIHYPKGTYNKIDSTRINIKFAPQSARSLTIAPFLSTSNLIPANTDLVIPPNSVRSFTETNQTLFVTFTAIGVSPHMHLLGQKIKCYVIDGNSLDTIPIIKINKWDFKWQGVYGFRKPLKIPPNSVAFAEATFDNTSANPYAIKDSVVVGGENTNDEMMLIFFAFTTYQNGDENMVLDSSAIAGIDEITDSPVKTIQFYEPYPNPADETINFMFFSPKTEKVKVYIYNIEGKEIDRLDKDLSAGFNYMDYKIKTLAAGNYMVKIVSDGGSKTRKFIKSN